MGNSRARVLQKNKGLQKKVKIIVDKSGYLIMPKIGS